MAQPITVNITLPTAGKVVPDSVSISGAVQSQFALQEATATVQSVTGSLSQANSSFAGVLDISTVPIGPQTLTVAVKDVYGTTGSAQVAIVHDRPPSLTVASPLDGSMARTSIRVAASCTDLDMYGCKFLTARVGGNVVASGVASIDEIVSLAAFEGQLAKVQITAEDAAGLTTMATQTVYVDSSPRLFEVDVVPGRIIDVDTTRVLYAFDGALRIRTRGTQNDVTILATNAPSFAELTDQGAFWADAEWNNGQLVPHANGAWRASGHFACGVVVPAGGNPDNLDGYFRDLSSGVTTLVFPAAEGLYANCDHIASNGDAIFRRVGGVRQEIHRYRGGVLTKVSTGSLNAVDGVTDGINVAFRRYSSTANLGSFLTTAAEEVTLNQGWGDYPVLPDYVLGEGWAAFTDLAQKNMDPVTVFMRAPTGTLEWVAPFAGVALIDGAPSPRRPNALKEPPTTRGKAIHDGTVAVLSGGSRYLARMGIPPEQISSDLGGARHIDADWHVVMGRHLFKVVPPGFDGGAPDAGPVDAGSSDVSAPDGGTPHASAPPANVPPDDGSTPTADPNGGDAPPGTAGDVPDDGACSASASRRGPIEAAVGPALLAVLAILRLARRARRT